MEPRASVIADQIARIAPKSNSQRKMAAYDRASYRPYGDASCITIADSKAAVAARHALIDDARASDAAMVSARLENNNQLS